MKLIIDIPDYNLNSIQNGSIACSVILRAVKNGKPYDERPHGEWKKSRFEPCGSFVEQFYKCSECGIEKTSKSNFCPYCGADMRKEGEAE